jgi:hypothetical protein
MWLRDPTTSSLHPVRGEGSDGSKEYEPSSMHRWFATCLKRAPGSLHFTIADLRLAADEGGDAAQDD